MISLIHLVWVIGGSIVGITATYTKMQMDIAKEREDRERELANLRKDTNGIGSKIRQDEGKAERRWKHMIATQIETSATLDEAKLHAKLLREDAWRD